ncbi:MAG: ribosomal L7Ae/L30e/S12e/Gadd45 family protein [Lachnospiraceae bacterium]|nr:ribosomal L7Ae/L30e/S12e/Gadd45 family protein [Lachnospiraceae bacterium]
MKKQQNQTRRKLPTQNKVSKDKVLSMIGLAVRAGKVVSGEFSTEKAIQTGKAAVVIVAGDASDNTKKKFTDKCNFYCIPFHIYGTKESLGHAMGKEERASLAIEDISLGQEILKRLEDC